MPSGFGSCSFEKILLLDSHCPQGRPGPLEPVMTQLENLFALKHTFLCWKAPLGGSFKTSLLVILSLPANPHSHSQEGDHFVCHQDGGYS